MTVIYLSHCMSPPLPCHQHMWSSCVPLTSLPCYCLLEICACSGFSLVYRTGTSRLPTLRSSTSLRRSSPGVSLCRCSTKMTRAAFTERADTGRFEGMVTVLPTCLRILEAVYSPVLSQTGMFTSGMSGPVRSSRVPCTRLRRTLLGLTLTHFRVTSFTTTQALSHARGHRPQEPCPDMWVSLGRDGSIRHSWMTRQMETKPCQVVVCLDL